MKKIKTNSSFPGYTISRNDRPLRNASSMLVDSYILCYKEKVDKSKTPSNTRQVLIHRQRITSNTESFAYLNDFHQFVFLI